MTRAGLSRVKLQLFGLSAGAVFDVAMALLAGSCGGQASSVGPDEADASVAMDSTVHDSTWVTDGRDAPVDVQGPARCDGPCTPPPSVCIDDSTMRWYSGECGDSGTCEFKPHDLPCDPSPTPPACFQGGCRVIVIR
jgi:hypothetical protein